MKKPLLSVCLITYNHSKYIRQSVDSVLCQITDFPWQLIIADDFSTDGTREILLEYQKKYPGKIKLILQEHNVGPERNWLELLNSPRSKYLLYGEGDDYFTDTTKLQRQVDFLESHPGHALCFHPTKVVFENKEQSDSIYPADSKGFTLERLLRENYMQTNTVMYRRQDYRAFPRGVVPGDWYLHLYHAQFGKIGFIDKVMSAYRRHKDGAWWDTYSEQEKIWMKHGMGQLAMFKETIRLYGGTQKYRFILEGHVAFLLAQLIDLDAKYRSQRFDEAISRFPELVGQFAVGQLKTIRELDAQRMRYAAELTDTQLRLDDMERKLAPFRRLDPRKIKVIFKRFAKPLKKLADDKGQR